MTTPPNYGNELSPKTFECFVCKKNGVVGVMVYLKGRDARGYPIRIEQDKVTPHWHRKPGETMEKQLPQQQPSQGTITSTVEAGDKSHEEILELLKRIDQRTHEILRILEGEK